MKSTLYFVIPVMIFSIFCYGCKKDEPTQIQESTGSSSLEYRYMLNGILVDHSGKVPYSSHYTESINDSLIYSGTMVSDLDLLSSNDTSLNLIFPSTSTGSWTNLTNAEMNLTIQQSGTINYYGLGTCSINVTEYGAVNDIVAGTFSGTLVSLSDTVKITQGTFNAKRIN